MPLTKLLLIILSATLVLFVISCKKEEPNSNINDDSNSQEELKVDFDLEKGYTPLAGCPKYLDTVSITATNKTTGPAIDFEWRYAVNNTRYWSGVEEKTLTSQRDWKRVFDLMLTSNLLRDSTFVKITLIAKDAEGHSSEKSKILAYGMMGPEGFISYDGHYYDVGLSSRILKLYYTNQTYSNGDCLVSVFDDNNDDGFSFFFDLKESALDAVQEVVVAEWPEISTQDIIYFRGDNSTLNGSVFGTVERPDVLQRIVFSGYVEDDDGNQKNLDVDINFIVAGKTLGSTLPDCKLD